ncbi:MAG: class I SAM-dependent methyltransferase [Rhizobiaceae bacterium]
MIDTELRDRVRSIRWFHNIDFGNGVVAEGGKSVDTLNYEADLYYGSMTLKDRSLIDIGAWNGFMSIEAKRRGAARVLATDHFAWTTDLVGRPGFELARERLAPDVEDMVIDVPDLTVERVGQFDAVLFAGVFYHLFEAPRYMKQVSALARHVMIVETQQDLLDVARPAMAYYPGTSLVDDPTNFWGPNPLLMANLLAEAGFKEIRYRPNRSHGRGVYLAFRDQASMAAMGFTERNPRDAADNRWRDVSHETGEVLVGMLARSAPRTIANLIRFFRREPMK